MAVTAPRVTHYAVNPSQGVTPIAASTAAYQGTLNLLNAAGYYDPAHAIRCCGLVVGPAELGLSIDNSLGDAGDRELAYIYNIRAELDASTTHPPTLADVEKPAYAEDGITVSNDPADGPFCGIIKGIAADGQIQVDLISSPAFAVPSDLVAALQTMDAADALVLPAAKKIFPVVGHGGAVTLTAAFPDGEYVGQEAVLIGTDDTNTVTVTTGLNNLTAGGVAATLAEGSTISFVWYGDLWIETARSLNA